MSANASDSAMSSSAGLGASAAYGARAVYYNSRRLNVPPVLANDYSAIVETRAMTHLVPGSDPPAYTNILQIPSEVSTWNDIYCWSPVVQVGPFLNESLPAALYAAYEYFRIRSVKVKLISGPLNQVNTQKVPVFIWYPERSSDIGAVPKDFLGPTYTDMLESGEKFVKIANSQEDTLQFTVIPQVRNAQNAQDTDQTAWAYNDIPSPWLKTNEANKSLDHTVPYFVWKKLYAPPDQLTAAYQVTMKVCIEFRDAKTSAV